MVRSVQIEPLTTADIASAVELAVRVLRVKPGDLREQFASYIADELRQMFVAKTNGHTVAYSRVIELAADEAGPGTPAGFLPQRRPGGSGVAAPGYRHRADAGPPVFNVTGADNTDSLHLHAALGFQEMRRFVSQRSAADEEVLSQLAKTAERR